jgi:hypothetical protein
VTLLATGQPKQHAFQYRLGRQGRVLEGLVCGQRDFVTRGGPHARMADRNFPVPHIDIAILDAMPYGRAAGIVLSLRSDQRVHFGGHELLQRLQSQT